MIVIAHSEQIPDGYASTTETATDLISHVGGKAAPANEDWDDGWRLKRRFAKGRCSPGFTGAGPEDHMRHLRRLGKIWQTAIEVDAHGRSSHGSANRTVEVPVGKGGEVQVAEIVSRLARASDSSLERPAADLTLSTQGLARAPWTRTLLSGNARP